MYKRLLKVIASALCAQACVTLTPVGARVRVYQAPLDGAPAQRQMPPGCDLMASSTETTMSELDMEGQQDPFRVERNEAGAVGANVLLVLSRMTLSRRDPECPTTAPITDCPPSLGAWFRVVVQRYACTAVALDTLAALPKAVRGAWGIVNTDEAQNSSLR